MSEPVPTGHEWQPASTPPALLPSEPYECYAHSQPVLVARTHSDGTRSQCVAIYRVDIEEPHRNEWRTDCSETWSIHDVTHWRPLDWPVQS